MERLKNMLFVHNAGERSVSVIDTLTLKEVGRILPDACGGRADYFPGAHSILPDKNRGCLYMTDGRRDAIHAIDLDSFKVVGTIYAGRNPADIAIGGDGGCLYVADRDSDSVSVIDMPTGRIISQIPVGSMPSCICTSPDGEYAYTANVNSRDISAIDTWSNSNVSTVALKGCPNSIIPSRDGLHMYVSCSGMCRRSGGFISVVSARGLIIQKDICCGSVPLSMALSARGDRLYAIDADLNMLFMIDLKRLEVAAKTGTGGLPSGIALDGNGNIFVSDAADDNISVIEQETLKLTRTIEAGPQPVSMCILD